jgi:hypothetical protein
MKIEKSGLIGIIVTIIGIVLLLSTFQLAYEVFQTYYPFKGLGQDLTSTLNLVLGVAVQAIFLGIMGWIGSIMLLRGVDFLKVDRGVGVVTFKVEKGTVVGIEELKEKK